MPKKPPAKMDFLEKVLYETQWLKDNPQFEERPATIEEFLGDGYLEIAGTVRPGLKKALIEIFGEETGTSRMSPYERAMFTGAIGVGKTTFISIVLPYMAHWVLCLKDPQSYFKLMPGSRIAFMMMSTSEKQVLEVVFGDVFARIDHCKWFEKYPRDRKLTKQIRFPKDVWILPGDSKETTFEGYNILGGFLDEMDSHQVTKDKDYADVGWDTIESRVASRFIDPKTKGHKGLVIAVGQMKKSQGFGARKYEELLMDPKAHVNRMTIWDSMGWDTYLNEQTGERESFWYDPTRKQIVPTAAIEVLKTTEHLIEIPEAYRNQFTVNPQKALRDLAGIPPIVEDAFISLTDRVERGNEAWNARHPELAGEGPLGPQPMRAKFAEWFTAKDTRKRVAHIDLATSGDGDALGLAMGHVDSMIRTKDGEYKPYIVFDLIMRIKAPTGSQIMISDVRNIIYYLKDDLHFRLKVVTMDGFNSTDTLQQLRRRRFQADYLSIDRSTLPYEDLRDAIYEERLEWPPYMTYLNQGDLKMVNIVSQELLQLQDTGKKIDHPAKGSKDCTDAMAGVVTTLMGDRSFHRRVVSNGAPEHSDDDPVAFDDPNSFQNRTTAKSDPFSAITQPPGVGMAGLSQTAFGVSIPRRLQPRK